MAASACRLEWFRFEAVAPDEMALFHPNVSHVALPYEAEEAVADFHALSQLTAANVGALLSWMSVSASDEAWHAAKSEYDLAGLWQLGQARSALLHCLLDARGINMMSLVEALRSLRPEAPIPALLLEAASIRRGLDAYACTGQRAASEQIFALDFDTPDLPRHLREIFTTTLVECGS
ncbi:MAG: hypothetical protein AAF825_02235 [Pseudomonadota bacterium]